MFGILNIMNYTQQKLLPKLQASLKILGENIRLARLRRRLSTEQISERANISRTTLTAIEKGSPSVSMANFAKVLFVLGLSKDLENIANDDVFGRKLQDIGLVTKKRAPKK